MNIKKTVLNIRAICLVLVIYITIVFVNFSVYAEDVSSKQEPIMVSLGDSYSSGEGIDNFYEFDLPIREKIESESKDWLAHRSQESWPGRLTLNGIDGSMKDHKDSHWYFVAASGAKTEHINEKQKRSYNQGISYIGTKWLPPQISVFDKLKSENKQADYVTLTLGGNDAGFEKVIKNAILEASYLNFGCLEDKLANTWNDFYKSGGIRDNLRKAYEDIAGAAGAQAKIIVAGYPQLITPEGKSFFSFKEADLINESVSNFNREINNIITSCKAEGMKICFVSVEEKFRGHEAFSESCPYINGIILPARPQDINRYDFKSAYSMHPTTDGARVYAECVQEKIDELEKDDGKSEWPNKITSEERDIVLVLDVSGSMAGEPLEETKKASTNFINTILKEDASIGIVAYDSSANKLSDFSVDKQSLQEITNGIVDGGGTNIEDGLAKAKEMLSESHAKKKIIVLMSDGEPNEGKVGDELVSYADSIKDDGTYIYTLGFFENMGEGKSDAQILMEKIASEGCHYEVADADDLRFFFGDIADQINGQKYIYIRIACPVDVSVSLDGESLSSEKNTLRTRTSFGTLTFEEGSDESANGSDDKTKILRLKDGPNYNVQINGNGYGDMDYTIGFMDENGEYGDVRKFRDIKISNKTKIDTEAYYSPTTVLKVDSDGDGKYDLKYKADANEAGEIVDYTYILYIINCIVAFIVLLVVYIKFKKWRAKVIQRDQQKVAMNRKFCSYCGSEMSGDKIFCTKCGKKII